MKTINTIDFDIIMGLSIDGYNDMIDPPRTDMDILCEKFPYFNLAKPNLWLYEYLTRYITEVAMKTDNIKFITSHEQIIDILSEEIEPFNLVNIDHHHDVNYRDEWKEPIIEVNSGNWVKRLLDTGNINHYTWVGNHNSIIFDVSSCPYMDKIGIEKIKDYDLGKLAAETEELILCYSPAYIPPDYRALFMIWRAIAEEIHNKDYILI